MNLAKHRLLLCVSFLFASSSCGDVNVAVMRGSLPREEFIEEINRTELVVRLELTKGEYDKFRNNGTPYLFYSDCVSYEPSVEIGFGVRSTEAHRDSRGNYSLRFVLIADYGNRHISSDWRRNLQCAYMRTTHGYNPVHYRSNIIRLGEREVGRQQT
jgi:hypothetical protein